MNRGIYGEFNFLKKIFMTEFVKTRLTTIEGTWIVAGWDKFHFACVKLDILTHSQNYFLYIYLMTRKSKSFFPSLFISLDFSFLRHIDFSFFFPFITPMQLNFYKENKSWKISWDVFRLFFLYIFMKRNEKSGSLLKKKYKK